MNILLIDSSYTSFYRFFATIRWYSFSQKEHFNEIKSNSQYDWLSNKLFMDTYSKMYLESIKKIVGTKVFKNSNIIFCQDDSRCKLWRNEIAKNYKEGRQDLTLKFNFKPIFEYTYNTLIPSFVKNNSNIFSIKVDCVEADDIIAVISNLTKKTNLNVYIVSGDDDFTQLGRNNLYIIDYKTKKIKQYTEEESRNKLRKKIIMGDKSDNIDSIFKNVKLSNLKKKEIFENNEKLLEFLNNHPESKNQYENNQKMIDFNYIPKTIKKKIMIQVDKQLNFINEPNN
jgi:5'-3' exonuclease